MLPFAILFAQVTVLDFSEPGQPDAWLPARTSDVVALKLRLLGLAVRDRRFARATVEPNESLVWGRVRPAEAEESDAIAIEVKVKRGGIEKNLRAQGRAGELDRMAADLALQIAGRPLDPKARELLASTGGHPFAVHRFLGRADRRVEAGDHVQATVMFDRAGSFANRGVIPEAILGRQRTEGARVALGKEQFGSRAELAASAEERASVALRDRDADGARRALTDVLRYTTARALRWSAELPLGGADRAVIVGRDKKWLVQTDAGPEGLWTLHPPTGVVLALSDGRKGLVGATGADVILLNGRVLSRDPPKGGPLWKVALPIEPSLDAWDRALLTEGSIGVAAKDGVAWVELALGALGQVAAHAEPLARSSSGILVRTDGQIGLLRPGKKTPAWTVAAAVDGAALTAERAILVSGEKLSILQVLDGKESRALAIPKGARLLSAYGRYACLAAQGGVHLYDVLSAEKTATLIGPPDPIDCHSESEEVAVLYRSGDLLFFDRDGTLRDRARAPGRPERTLRGSPIAPGPVVVTDRGLYAFAEVGHAMRDVDAMMRIAELELQRKDSAAALRLADWVAMRSAGQVAKAEAMRAAILKELGHLKAAERAQKRAATKPTDPLPPFALE